jgi:integrase
MKKSKLSQRRSGLVLPGAHRIVTGGRVYWYAYRGGPKMWSGRLEDEERAAVEIARAYVEMRDHRPAVGTVARAAHEFLHSPAWAKFAASTQAAWLPHVEWIKERLGWMNADEWRRDARDRVYERHQQIAERAPRTADMFLQVVSKFHAWASNVGRKHLHPEPNPIKGIDKAYRAAPQRAPSLAEVREAQQALPAHLADAVELALNTGLRRADLCAVDRVAVQMQFRRIAWMPAKTARWHRTVYIPIKDDLAALLDRLAPDGPLLRNQWGEPWTPDGLSSSLWKAIGKRWSLHDLRRACATHLAQQGWSSRDMALVLGWSENDCEALATTYVDEDVKSRVKVSPPVLPELQKTEQDQGARV